MTRRVIRVLAVALFAAAMAQAFRSPPTVMAICFLGAGLVVFIATTSGRLDLRTVHLRYNLGREVPYPAAGRHRRAASV